MKYAIAIQRRRSQHSRHVSTGYSDTTTVELGEVVVELRGTSETVTTKKKNQFGVPRAYTRSHEIAKK